MTPGDPLIRAGEAINAMAVGERVADFTLLLARCAERYAQGTLCHDEVEALLRVMRGSNGVDGE